MTLELIGINELEVEAVSLKIEIVTENGDAVLNETIHADWKSGVSQMFKEKIMTNNWRGNYQVNVSVKGDKNSFITENSYGFSVFQNIDLAPPKAKIAVLDTENSLASFLKKKGIKVVEFAKNTSKSIPLFVTGTQAKRETTGKQENALDDFMKDGGNVVFLNGVGGAKITVNEKSTMYPFSALVHPSQGLWTCMPHLIHDHPIFAGLPSNTVMRDIYENLWARTTLRELKNSYSGKPETIVGTVGFDWFSEGHKMHYSGPGDSWWGSDLAIMDAGNGRCIVSQLRLLDNLGKDPVADKILFNLIKFLDEHEN